MNVMALKTEYDWRVQRPEKKFDYRMPQASWWTPLELTPLATPPPPPPAEHLASTSPQVFHEALLASPHRTALAAEADYFYVPTWDFHGSWGNPEVRDRTHRHNLHWSRLFCVHCGFRVLEEALNISNISKTLHFS